MQIVKKFRFALDVRYMLGYRVGCTPEDNGSVALRNHLCIRDCPA